MLVVSYYCRLLVLKYKVFTVRDSVWLDSRVTGGDI